MSFFVSLWRALQRWLRQRLCDHKWLTVYQTETPRFQIQSFKYTSAAEFAQFRRLLCGSTTFHERCEHCNKRRTFVLLGHETQEPEE